MSLINDALRRAQQEQHKATPVQVADHGLQMLRPVEPRPSGRGMKWILALLVILLTGAASGFVWIGRRQHATAAPTVAAGNHTLPPPAPIVAPPVAVRIDEEVKPKTVAAPPVLTNTVIVVVTNFVEAAPPVTTALPPPAPVFPALKLQGVFYRPSNPSVMLNGQTLFLNDEVEKVKVVTITPNTVTVVWFGQTNVLTLR